MAIDDLVIDELFSKVGINEFTQEEVFLIRRFLKIKKAKKGFTNPTRENYLRDFKLFKSQVKKPILNVNGGDITDFFVYLERTKNYKKTTQARKYASLKTFYEFLKEEEHIEMHPMDEIKRPKIDLTLPIFPTAEELYEFIEASKNSKFKILNLAIIGLFLFTNARVSEIRNLNFGDISSEKDTIEYISKGKKTRSVRIKPIVRQLIEKYLSIRPKVENSDALFINDDGKRLEIRSIQNKVSKYRKGISPNITSEKLRRFFKNALDSGMDIEIITNRVKELLSDKNLKTPVPKKQQLERIKTTKVQLAKDTVSQTKLDTILSGLK